MGPFYKELIYNIERSNYDCIAHIHTHPYIGGTCRFFSNQDLRTIQTLQKNFSQIMERKSISLEAY